MDKIKINNPTARTIGLIAFSLLCSLLLWVYVTETRGEDIDRPFPGVQVVFEGESTIRETRELIVSEAATTSVTVNLTGNRRTLTSLKSDDLTVVVDLNNITRTGSYSLATSVRYPARIDTSAITSAETDPATISFYVDKLGKKTLEVKGVNNGSAAEGYVQDSLEFSPSTVIVYGPEEVLAEVADAYVDVNLTDVDRTRTFDSTYILRDSDGNEIQNDEITFDTDTVSVTLPISAVKDVSLTVELDYGGGVAEENVKWDLQPNRIQLTGDSETLAGVNTITVARIDLAQITENTFTESYLITIPNDTEITGGTRETTLTLELGGLYKDVFQVSRNNISCINVSEEYVADIGNDFLDVTIRGAEEAVKAIDPVNIRAVADLTDYGTTTRSVMVPVRIYIDGATDVGAVGEYRVLVNIRAAGEEIEETE